MKHESRLLPSPLWLRNLNYSMDRAHEERTNPLKQKKKKNEGGDEEHSPPHTSRVLKRKKRQNRSLTLLLFLQDCCDDPTWHTSKSLNDIRWIVSRKNHVCFLNQIQKKSNEYNSEVKQNQRFLKNKLCSQSNKSVIQKYWKRKRKKQRPSSSLF